MKFYTDLFFIFFIWTLCFSAGDFLIAGIGFFAALSSCALMRVLKLEYETSIVMHRLSIYIFWLFKEIFFSSVFVLRTIYSHKLSLNSQITVLNSSHSGDALLLLLHSITNTPGTVSINYIDGSIYVHVLDKSLLEGISDIETFIDNSL